MRSREALSPAGFPLSAVVATSELKRRAPRAPDFETENRALTALAQTLGASHGSTLQKLVDVALDLCNAHSAGITLLEAGTDGPVLDVVITVSDNGIGIAPAELDSSFTPRPGKHRRSGRPAGSA
jgi:C4-dicarboxylate-specific signal transduction histidine kinase